MTLDFVGLANDRVIDLGTANVPGSTGALTVTAWINPDAVGLADEQVIIAKSGSTANTGAFKMQVENSGNGNVLRGILNSTVLDSPGAISAGVWTFVAMRYTGAAQQLYINGAQVATQALSGNVATSANPLRIAAVNTGTEVREFDGPLDDIRVYTRALTPNELLTLYTLRGGDNIVNGLLWRWRMAELAPGTAATGAGSVKDAAGNLNGTPLNSPTYVAGILV